MSCHVMSGTENHPQDACIFSAATVGSEASRNGWSAAERVVVSVSAIPHIVIERLARFGCSFQLESAQEMLSLGSMLGYVWGGGS